MSIKIPVVHLMSGGLDSTVLLYDLKGRDYLVHALLFNYGQKHIRELMWAKHHCERLNVEWNCMEIPQLLGSKLTDGSGSYVVPSRNAVFLSLAANVAVLAKAETVTYAVNKDDEAMFPDCRARFIEQFNAMLSACEIPVRVWAPYLDKPKSWIAALGQEIGVNMVETWSCYEGGKIACGKCPACLKRKEIGLL